MFQSEVDAAAQQDALRPFRQFVSLLNAVNEQTYVTDDGFPYNPTRQFQVVGPYGSSVEGQPIRTTVGGGLVLSPAVVWIGIGVAAVLFWPKKG